MAPRRYRSLATLPPGFRFQPNGRDVVVHYLSHKVLRGELPEDVVSDGIADDVDIFSTHPANLTFPPCNQMTYGKVWAYFFQVGPIGDQRGTPEGYWNCYGEEKVYVGDDGKIIAFRNRFAFYGDDDKLTPWRMKEYRLDKNSSHLGNGRDPKAGDYVVCKVYNKVDIPEDELPFEWVDGIDDDVMIDDDEDEGYAVPAANTQQQQQQ